MDTEILTEDLSAADRVASWQTAISDEFVPVTVGRVTERDPQGRSVATRSVAWGSPR